MPVARRSAAAGRACAGRAAALLAHLHLCEGPQVWSHQREEVAAAALKLGGVVMVVVVDGVAGKHKRQLRVVAVQGSSLVVAG